MKIPVPAGSPPYLGKLVRDIERSLQPRYADQPFVLKGYDTNDLPDPKVWPKAVIWLNNTNTMAVSDGTSWYPVTLGAPL